MQGREGGDGSRVGRLRRAFTPCRCVFRPVLRLLSLRPRHTVVDIAPGVGKISPEFRAYLDAMKEIDDAKVMSRKEADTILHKTEPVRVLLCFPPLKRKCVTEEGLT